MDATPAAGAGSPVSKTPTHLWVVGILALLWTAVGAFDYVATQFEIGSYMEAFTPEQLEFFYGLPSWVVAAWAIAVWSAVAGSVGLLLRKSWSTWLFGASIAGMVITTLHNFGFSNGAEIMGTAGILFSLLIWIIAILLLIYSQRQSKNGVLR